MKYYGSKRTSGPYLSNVFVGRFLEYVFNAHPELKEFGEIRILKDLIGLPVHVLR